jgi:hypothetical protein
VNVAAFGQTPTSSMTVIGAINFVHVLKDNMVFAGSFRAMIETLFRNGQLDVPGLVLASTQDPTVLA